MQAVGWSCSSGEEPLPSMWEGLRPSTTAGKYGMCFLAKEIVIFFLEAGSPVSQAGLELAK